ncbi:MAG: GAF domain-containing protein, partial [Anaerolineae bacterium]|nr:GAF domain-containing protein [Anaerolineae bacterium]
SEEGGPGLEAGSGAFAPATDHQIAIPLMVTDKVLGVLNIQQRQVNALEQTDLDTFNILARQVAIALYNASLFEQIEQHLKDTKVRLDVSQALSSTKSEDDVLDTMMHQMSFYPFTSVGIYLTDSAADQLTMIAAREAFPQHTRSDFPRGRRITEDEIPFMRYLTPVDTIVIDNIDQDARVDPVLYERVSKVGARSFAVFPITVGQQWLGNIVAFSEQVDDFDPQQIRLYQMLAEQGAIALREARLRNQLLRVNAAIESTSDAILLVDLDGNATYFNNAFSDLFGYDLVDLNRFNYLAHLFRENEQGAGIFEHALHNGLWYGETILRTHHNTIVPVDLRVNIIQGETGQAAGLIYAITDLSERQVAQANLRESLAQAERAKREWEFTADALPQFVALLDYHGYIVRANRTVETWGLSKVVNVRKQQLHDLLHPHCDDIRCYLHTLWASTRSPEFGLGNPVEMDVKDEQLERYLNIQIHPIQTNTNSKEAVTIFAVTVIQDISRRIRLVSELTRHQRHLETLVEARTIELTLANNQLQEQIAERKKIEAALK